MKLDEETMNNMIENAEYQLNELKKQQRKDLGIKRGKYASHLPQQYKSYIMRANKKGIEFSLSPEQFDAITKSLCVYCGDDNKIGVDRINSKLGYVIDNVQPCCGTCNLMKHVNSHTSFITHITRIYQHMNQP